MKYPNLPAEPWPAARPAIPAVTTPQWFGEGHERCFRKLLPKNLELYVELGSWLGNSAGFVLKNWPQAEVIAIDHFKGSAEHQGPDYPFLPHLYEHFCQNLWAYKDRLTVLRMDSLAALLVLHEKQVRPDAIYIDAAHDTYSVFEDVFVAVLLFPDSFVFGDDWLWDTVREGMQRAVQRLRRDVHNEGNIWWLTKPN